MIEFLDVTHKVGDLYGLEVFNMVKRIFKMIAKDAVTVLFRFYFKLDLCLVIPARSSFVSVFFLLSTLSFNAVAANPVIGGTSAGQAVRSIPAQAHCAKECLTRYR